MHKPTLTRKRPDFFCRSTALLVSLCLVFSHAVHAGTGPASAAVEIPPGYGAIEEFHAGTNGKTIIYIQDAHDSLEAQTNIANLITHLVRRVGIKTVFEEGYEGPVPTDQYFGSIEDAAERQKASYFLLDKLRIGGAEYAHVNRTQDFRLIGADNLELHRRNLAWYRRSATNQAEVARQLSRINKEVEKLSLLHFPLELRQWMKLRARFDAESIDLMTYLERLVSLAPAVFESATEFPNLRLLLKISKNREAVKSGEPEAIDPKQAFLELDRLEDRIAASFLADERNRKIFSFYKQLRLLSRLNALSVTPDEYAVLSSTLRRFDTRGLARFVAAETRHSVVLPRSWERSIQDAGRFYDTARKRDAFVKRHLESFVKQQDETAAVLVFGGFHRPDIRRILKEAGFTYFIVSPRITEISRRHQDYYRRLMGIGHYEFEAPLMARAAKTASIYDIPFGRAELLAVGEIIHSHPQGRALTSLDIETMLAARSEVREPGGRDPLKALLEELERAVNSFTAAPSEDGFKGAVVLIERFAAHEAGEEGAGSAKAELEEVRLRKKAKRVAGGGLLGGFEGRWVLSFNVSKPGAVDQVKDIIPAKAVRDGIPEIVKANILADSERWPEGLESFKKEFGRFPYVQVSEPEFLELLKVKAAEEELPEVAGARNRAERLEELADLLEVLMKIRGLSLNKQGPAAQPAVLSVVQSSGAARSYQPITPETVLEAGGVVKGYGKILHITGRGAFSMVAFQTLLDGKIDSLTAARAHLNGKLYSPPVRSETRDAQKMVFEGFPGVSLDEAGFTAFYKHARTDPVLNTFYRFGRHAFKLSATEYFFKHMPGATNEELRVRTQAAETQSARISEEVKLMGEIYDKYRIQAGGGSLEPLGFKRFLFALIGHLALEGKYHDIAALLRPYFRKVLSEVPYEAVPRQKHRQSPQDLDEAGMLGRLVEGVDPAKVRQAGLFNSFLKTIRVDGATSETMAYALLGDAVLDNIYLHSLWEAAGKDPARFVATGPLFNARKKNGYLAQIMKYAMDQKGLTSRASPEDGPRYWANLLEAIVGVLYLDFLGPEEQRILFAREVVERISPKEKIEIPDPLPAAEKVSAPPAAAERERLAVLKDVPLKSAIEIPSWLEGARVVPPGFRSRTLETAASQDREFRRHVRKVTTLLEDLLAGEFSLEPGQIKVSYHQSGGYSDIYHVRILKTGRKYEFAVKFAGGREGFFIASRARLIRDVQTLRNLKSSRLVQYFGSIWGTDNYPIAILVSFMHAVPVPEAIEKGLVTKDEARDLAAEFLAKLWKKGWMIHDATGTAGHPVRIRVNEETERFEMAAFDAGAVRDYSAKSFEAVKAAAVLALKTWIPETSDPEAGNALTKAGFAPRSEKRNAVAGYPEPMPSDEAISRSYRVWRRWISAGDISGRTQRALHTPERVRIDHVSNTAAIISRQIAELGQFFPEGKEWKTSRFTEDPDPVHPGWNAVDGLHLFQNSGGNWRRAVRFVFVIHKGKVLLRVLAPEPGDRKKWKNPKEELSRVLLHWLIQDSTDPTAFGQWLEKAEAGIPISAAAAPETVSRPELPLRSEFRTLGELLSQIPGEPLRGSGKVIDVRDILEAALKRGDSGFTGKILAELGRQIEAVEAAASGRKEQETNAKLWTERLARFSDKNLVFVFAGLSGSIEGVADGYIDRRAVILNTIAASKRKEFVSGQGRALLSAFVREAARTNLRTLSMLARNRVIWRLFNEYIDSEGILLTGAPLKHADGPGFVYEIDLDHYRAYVRSEVRNADHDMPGPESGAVAVEDRLKAVVNAYIAALYSEGYVDDVADEELWEGRPGEPLEDVLARAEKFRAWGGGELGAFIDELLPAVEDSSALVSILKKYDRPTEDQKNLRRTLSKQTGFPAEQIIFAGRENAFPWVLAQPGLHEFIGGSIESESLPRGIHLRFKTRDGKATDLLIVRNDADFLQTAFALAHEISHTRQSDKALALYERNFYRVLFEGYQVYNEIQILHKLAQGKSSLARRFKEEVAAALRGYGKTADPSGLILSALLGETSNFRNQIRKVHDTLYPAYPFEEQIVSDFSSMGGVALQDIETVFTGGDTGTLERALSGGRLSALEVFFEKTGRRHIIQLWRNSAFIETLERQTALLIVREFSKGVPDGVEGRIGELVAVLRAVLNRLYMETITLESRKDLDRILEVRYGIDRGLNQAGLAADLAGHAVRYLAGKMAKDELSEELDKAFVLRRSEIRSVAGSAAKNAEEIRKLNVPVGIFIDAAELVHLAPGRADERLDELLMLLSEHPGLDLYIDHTDRYPVFNIRSPQLEKLLEEYGGRVHLGMHDRANLSKKLYLVQAGFMEAAKGEAQTQAALLDLRSRFQYAHEILPFAYDRAGAMKAFLDLAESVKPAELLRKAAEAMAVKGPDGRWHIAADFAASLWNRVQADFAIAWSA